MATVEDYSTLRARAIPTDLHGKTVLDLGGYDGRYDSNITYLCRDRGARVTIVDNGEYLFYGWGEPNLRRLHEDGINFVKDDLFAWHETADIVILYNVLYHLENPIGGLRHCRTLTREKFIICTSFIEGDGYIWRLYDETDPGQRAIDNHYTVFFKPTVNALSRALHRVGFKNVKEVGRSGDHIIFSCE